VHRSLACSRAPCATGPIGLAAHHHDAGLHVAVDPTLRDVRIAEPFALDALGERAVIRHRPVLRLQVLGVAPLGPLIILQAAQEPVACQICHLVERAGSLEQVRGARHNLQAGLAAQLPKRIKVYVMCEVPSNVVPTEAFAARYDGSSIGSNDLCGREVGLCGQAPGDYPDFARFLVDAGDRAGEPDRGALRAAVRQIRHGLNGQAWPDAAPAWILRAWS
jgi:hypothetical protein